MTEAPYPYRFPTLADAPSRLVDVQRSFTHLEPAELAGVIGVYCEEPSHEGDPWPIGMLDRSHEVRRQMGRDYWGARGTYPVGTGHLLRVAGVQEQLVDGRRRLETDDDGLPVRVRVDDSRTDEYGAPLAELVDVSRARTRYRLQCARCGLAVTVRQETLQRVAEQLHAAGVRDVTLSLLSKAVQRLA